MKKKIRSVDQKKKKNFKCCQIRLKINDEENVLLIDLVFDIFVLFEHSVLKHFVSLANFTVGEFNLVWRQSIVLLLRPLRKHNQ